MEIKGSNTYAANASMQLAATEKTAELAQQTTAATVSTNTDSVTISEAAKALLNADQAATTTADGDPPGWPPTGPVKTAADGDPPGWPPTTDD